jgi:hypothetical protein
LGGAIACQRVVANELVELAWTQPGENWKDEKLDGAPYELPEPGKGEIWTRSDFKLPEEGRLEVTYQPSARVPRYSDVLSATCFFELVNLLNDKELTEQGRQDLIRLSAKEFFFTAAFTATLITMSRDTSVRVAMAAVLYPRTVDLVTYPNPRIRAGLVRTQLPGEICIAHRVSLSWHACTDKLDNGCEQPVDGRRATRP